MSGAPLERCPACGESRTLLSIGAAARLVDVNRKTIYRWIEKGLLEFRRLPSGNIRIFQESLLKVPRGPRRAHHAKPGTATSAPKRPANHKPAARFPPLEH